MGSHSLESRVGVLLENTCMTQMSGMGVALERFTAAEVRMQPAQDVPV